MVEALCRSLCHTIRGSQGGPQRDFAPSLPKTRRHGADRGGVASPTDNRDAHDREHQC